MYGVDALATTSFQQKAFRRFSDSFYLALENHLNYVYHADRELTVDEVYGLTALFNSALLDRYFRLISGNTQVNATEIRSIRFPNLGRVAMIGQRLKMLADFRPEKVERIVLESLGIHGRIADDLTGSAP
jgi:adenine-specific DNA-methyltransferase